jgi:hypothetical protein
MEVLMPLQATSGAASYDAFGGGVAAVPNYIEDVFSTWLYNGNSSTQTINNGIDLAGKGGLVWIKARNTSTGHALFNTSAGRAFSLASNTTDPQISSGAGLDLASFNANGFTLGDDSQRTVNSSGLTFASWTFREQPKFFDVVTYTGNGTTQNIPHNLAGTVGTLIVKRTDTGGTNWLTYHRSLPTNEALALNTTQASSEYFTPTIFGNNTVSVAPTSTQFTVGNFSAVNASGGTYVAYLFAHNAGGFGLTGNDNVISCGSYTGNGSANGPVVNLGYEPQCLLIKGCGPTTTASNWYIVDNMRGIPTGSADSILLPNTSGAEISLEQLSVNSTGFNITATSSAVNTSGDTYIYIAIRRGPMKVPTTGTSVFDPETSSSSTGTTITTNFPVDLQVVHGRTVVDNVYWADRLRGINSPGLSSNSPYLLSDNTNAETTGPGITNGWNNTGFNIGSAFGGASYVYWNFRRAPGFFDEVCYTGTGGSRSVSHNLNAIPEMIIWKERTNVDVWRVGTNFTPTTWNATFLNQTGSGTDLTYGSTRQYTARPTSTQFFVSEFYNDPSQSIVAYLFASCPGVSKVTNFTGTGALQTINCGFTSGARFVLIKRTDSTGNWFVWDSSRGLSSSNDPYLLLNSTAAEVTSTNWVDTTSTGFQVTAASGNDVNISGASYIALAIS